MKKGFIRKSIRILTLAIMLTLAMPFVTARAEEIDNPNDEIITGNEIFEGYIEDNEKEPEPVQKILIIVIAVTAGGVLITSVLISLGKKKKVVRSRDYIRKQNEKVKAKRANEQEDLANIIKSYEEEYSDEKIDKNLTVVKNAPKYIKKESKPITIKEKKDLLIYSSEDERKTQEEAEVPIQETTVTASQTTAPTDAVQQPVYQQPVIIQPVYQQPIMQPVYQQSIMQPVYQQPIIQPVYQQPIMQPAYQQPIAPVQEMPKTEPEKKIPAYARKKENDK